MMLIGIGAGLGAWLRWQITSFWKKRGINWPVATLLINLAGTLLLGYLIHHLATERNDFWTTGFLGGLTTFSTFNVEVISLLDEHRWGAAILYLALSYGGGLLLAALGMLI